MPGPTRPPLPDSPACSNKARAEEDEENGVLQLSGEEEVAEEEAVLKAVFAKRAEELRKALVRGREWLGGVKDDLAERLTALATCPTARVSVWAERPLPLALSITQGASGRHKSAWSYQSARTNGSVSQ